MKYIEDLVNKIIQKPELASIDADFVTGQIVDFIDRHITVKKKLEASQSFGLFQKSKEFNMLFKAVREKLRKPYGLFQIDLKKRTELLKRLAKEPDSMELHSELLKTHRSTKERQEIYPELYSELFRITGRPHKLLDLGCGLNPLSFPWMHLPDMEYTAVELSKNDIAFINQYFRLKHITGKALALNLITDYAQLRKLSADVCFMFKLLDSLEAVEKDISEKLIQSIDAKYIAVSFSTRTIGGRSMRAARRAWFEHMLERLDYKFELLEYNNEIFYVLSKK